jgi:hypothetical protein
MPAPVTRRDSLRPLEAPLIGAWITCCVCFWVASLVHERMAGAELAAALDRALRVRLGFGEAGIAFFLVLLLLRRRAHGFELFLPFFAAAVAAVGALWLAPDLAAIAASRTSGKTPEHPLLHHLLGISDSIKVTALFVLLVLEIPWRRSRS